ncbi:MAG: hypothetical protein JSV54_02800 [Chloroflexota bacterium]|nr:MAG: hypothetical protein JSV54_02800 [Chloroflexota bacterium]
MKSKEISSAFLYEGNEVVEICIPPSYNSTKVLSFISRLEEKFHTNHDFARVAQTFGSEFRGIVIRILTDSSTISDCLEMVGNLVKTLAPEEEPKRDSWFFRLAQKLGLPRESSIDSPKRFVVTLKEDSITS